MIDRLIGVSYLKLTDEMRNQHFIYDKFADLKQTASPDGECFYYFLSLVSSTPFNQDISGGIYSQPQNLNLYC